MNMATKKTTVKTTSKAAGKPQTFGLGDSMGKLSALVTGCANPRIVGGIKWRRISLQ